MAITDTLTKEFLAGIEEIEKELALLHFQPYSFEEKGFAYFIKYRREETFVQFLFGPPDWDVEMIVFASGKTFAFKDLLQIPSVAKWVSENKYTQDNGRSVKNELFWAIKLLKFSLPIIE